MKCSAMTRKRQPCPIEAKVLYFGVPLCHVHHPNMTYRRQIEAKHKRRLVAIAKRRIWTNDQGL